ncbi:GPR1/FUN34/yaaH family-domain-containing protein [Lactarius quietus]|nr:GPR1/FUN34/yaaH family-domain-containing protein [Lactarius quietus]
MSSEMSDIEASYIHHPIAPKHTNLGNPGPLGLFSFMSTTLILSLYNFGARTRGITTPNIVVGMALFCSGLTQLLAGQWEYTTGNTFGATGKFLIQGFSLCTHMI